MTLEESPAPIPAAAAAAAAGAGAEPTAPPSSAAESESAAAAAAGAAATTAATAAGGGVFNVPSLEEIEKDLLNNKINICIKMNHLFFLRHIHNKQAILLLIKALKDKSIIDSVLFRHEAAYVLGQLGDNLSIKFLEQTLNDYNEHEMVRHEAAEALAAIGSQQSLDLLSAHLNDESIAVRQTCELAVDKLRAAAAAAAGEEEEEKGGGGAAAAGEEDSSRCCSPYKTVDPSSPYLDATAADIPNLSNILNDDTQTLTERYRALFTLRDLQHPAAVAAVAAALQQDSSSALLRHEIAFVLGQIQFPTEPAAAAATAASGAAGAATTTAAAAARASAAALLQCLNNKEEHSMARHEAALALGSLAAAAEAADTQLDPAAAAAAAAAAANDDDKDTSAAAAEAAAEVAAAASCLQEGDRGSIRSVALQTLRHHCLNKDKIVAESCLVALNNIQEELAISLQV